MERREFLTAVAGGVTVGQVAGWGEGRLDHPAIRRSTLLQEPTLGRDVFARRLDRLRAELTTRKLDLFVAAPATNFEYFTGTNRAAVSGSSYSSSPPRATR